MKPMNRLATESSLYLRQHAGNPVNWYPWGEEALKLAKKEEKPIFLSIGYSSCHWCHVMEKESFEDPGIASLLNRYFVSIKVDREERPDLDNYFMQSVQIMTGQGGWPLSVFLTHDLKPFYGGTYFPPVDRHRLPGFGRIIEHLGKAWNENRKQLLENARTLHATLNQTGHFEKTSGIPGEDLLHNAFGKIRNSYDEMYGGFTPPPKFPQPMILEFLLRYHRRTGNEKALEMAASTLTRMASGGLFDQLGGGFHRYCVEKTWLLPHFEKMLYDNALLCSLYTTAYRITENTFFQETAERTASYILREMVPEGGGFACSQDADVSGEEGACYVWDSRELNKLLSPEEIKKLNRMYGFPLEGNWGDKIIFTRRDRSDDKTKNGNPVSHADSVRIREKLFHERQKRPQPGRDDKRITDWNSLMISALCLISEPGNNNAYLQSALNGVRYLLNHHIRDEQLLHALLKDRDPVPGFLRDYAFFTSALLDLYESTLDLEWLYRARDWGERTVSLFYDQSAGGFFSYRILSDTPGDARPKEPYDSSLPSGDSVILAALLRLKGYFPDMPVDPVIENTFRFYGKTMETYPSGMAGFLNTLDRFLTPLQSVVLAGSPDNAGLKKAHTMLRSGFDPNRIIGLVSPETAGSGRPLPGLLEGKNPGPDGPAAFVCLGRTCLPPVTDLDALSSIVGSRQV
jgi:uncharacterized protein YyaL (SSP411 family)